MFCYIGLSIGGVASGVLSHIMRSRKRVLALFLTITTLVIVMYFAIGSQSLTLFYATVLALGFGGGYWAVFITTASEQFGTNIRATVTTTAPNFVRGAVVLLTSAFRALEGPLGLQGSAILVGVVTMAISFAALAGLHETYGKDLGFVEET